MKSILYSVLAITLLSFVACTSDVDKRVTDLERRVAALESKGGTAAQPVNLNAAQNAQNDVQANIPQEKPDGPLPTLSFEDQTHDFGKIKEGDVVSKVFKFTNTGEAPLIISNATSSCGCTVPSYPKDKPIAPGESGEIKVEYNSRGKKNQDNKVVRITANTWPATNNLTIKAFVEPKAETADAGPLKQ